MKFRPVGYLWCTNFPPTRDTKMRHMRSRCILCSSLMTATCGVQPFTASTDQVAATPEVTFATQYLGGTCGDHTVSNPVQHLLVYWDCAEVVRFTYNSSGMPSGVLADLPAAMSNAASAWISRLKPDLTGMPKIAYNATATNGHVVTVIWESGQPGSNNCGTVVNASGYPPTEISPPTTVRLYNCHAGSPSIETLRTHELAHV